MQMSAFGSKADIGCTSPSGAMLIPCRKRGCRSRENLFDRPLGSEDYAAETSESESKVDAANYRHSCEQGPDDRKIGAPIQNRLRKGRPLMTQSGHVGWKFPAGQYAHSCEAFVPYVTRRMLLGLRTLSPISAANIWVESISKNHSTETLE